MEFDCCVLNYHRIKNPTSPPGYQRLQCGDAAPQEWLTDTTGDSISADNWYYSELTGQYWAWKNTRGDNIGFCHYHRFLGESGQIFSPEKIDGLLKHYHLVLPCKYYCSWTVGEHFAHHHTRMYWIHCAGR